MRKILGAMAVLLLASAAHVFPASAEVPVLASKAIDNEQVTAWDITLKPGQTGPLTPTDQDAVILYLEGGTTRMQAKTGGGTATHQFGDAVFVPKGSGLRETAMKAGTMNEVPVHEIVVWLKDTKSKTVANPTKYPAAWPRPGAVKTLENERVVAWNYSWLKGRPAPMHFHIHQQVIGERYTGAIKTIMEDGKVTMGPTEAGQIRFTEPGRMHSEEWGAGKVSAVILELK